MQATWLDTLLLRSKKQHFLSQEQRFASGIGYADLGDFLIRYQLVGEPGKPIIVFSPDPPNVIEHYADLIALLQPDFQVLIFEMPGFGFSLPTRTGFTFTLGEAVQLTSRFFDELHIQRAHLCFPCVTGFVATELARQRPDLVGKIIVVQTPSWEEQARWAKRIDFKGIMATPFLGQFFLQSRKRWIAKQWYRVALPRESTDDRFNTTSQNAFDQGACYCLASGLQGFFQHSAPPSAEPLFANALVVWGDRDRTHRHTDKATVPATFNASQVQHFDRAGHFPELEFPEQFAALLKASIL
ncbi:MAG: alpha/beta hydrolase [Lewinellaceae bacterium]|nr:alpha/beta hydrolase [Lewinellaceae bacterium]